MTNKEKLEFLTSILENIDISVSAIKRECYHQIDCGYSEEEIELPTDEVRRLFDDVVEGYKAWLIVTHG